MDASWPRSAAIMVKQELPIVIWQRQAVTDLEVSDLPRVSKRADRFEYGRHDGQTRKDI